jgi:phosphoenolpyruvate-protein kinase (PTS system EI component)
MITFADEIVRVRELLEDAGANTGIQHRPPLGAMIETPAAALCTSHIAEHADFLSIGTNDLTQYTMVACRENPLVSDYFVDDHPAIRRLLGMVAKESGDTPLSICGELAGSPEGIAMAVDAGIRSLSVAPPLIPDVKHAIRNLSV